MPCWKRFIQGKWTRQILLICDGSIALIQSTVLSFFKETLKSYLDRCFIIASGKCAHSLTWLSPHVRKPLHETYKVKCKTEVKSVMLSMREVSHICPWSSAYQGHNVEVTGTIPWANWKILGDTILQGNTISPTRLWPETLLNDSVSKCLWLWLDNNDSGTSLVYWLQDWSLIYQLYKKSSRVDLWSVQEVVLCESYVIYNSFSRTLVTSTERCPRHAQIYNEETSTRPLSFDFALSFNTRQNYIHSWFYYCNFKALRY